MEILVCKKMCVHSIKTKKEKEKEDEEDKAMEVIVPSQ